MFDVFPPYGFAVVVVVCVFLCPAKVRDEAPFCTAFSTMRASCACSEYVFCVSPFPVLPLLLSSAFSCSSPQFKKSNFLHSELESTAKL